MHIDSPNAERLAWVVSLPQDNPTVVLAHSISDGYAEQCVREGRAMRGSADGGSTEMTGLRPDITPLPDLLHGHSRAGPVRESRPVYVDLLPPCNAGCPAGENIQAWMAHVKVGEHELAWRVLTTDNPFPAINGRVCYHT